MAKNVITAEPRTITIELTEDEFDVVCIAVEMLNDSIKNGDIDLYMGEKEAFELGQAIGGICDTLELDLDVDELDEDE